MDLVRFLFNRYRLNAVVGVSRHMFTELDDSDDIADCTCSCASMTPQ